MNIQIFGKSKCFDSKKAERYFKERGIKFQAIDLAKFGMSKGELQSVLKAVGGIDSLINENHADATIIKYLAYEQDKFDKLLENPQIIKTPVVRNSKLATIGFQPDIWKNWN